MCLVLDNYKITEALQGLMQRTKNVKNNVKNFMFNGSISLPPENILDSMPDNVIEPSFTKINSKNDLLANENTSAKDIAEIENHNKISKSESYHSNSSENNKNEVDAKGEEIPSSEANEFVDEFIERYILGIAPEDEPKVKHASTSYDDFSLSDLPHDIAIGIHERYFFTIIFG